MNLFRLFLAVWFTIFLVVAVVADYRWRDFWGNMLGAALVGLLASLAIAAVAGVWALILA